VPRDVLLSRGSQVGSRYIVDHLIPRAAISKLLLLLHLLLMILLLWLLCGSNWILYGLCDVLLELGNGLKQLRLL